METGILIAAVFIFSGFLWFGYFYKREKRILDRLLHLVEQAESGNLIREDISEEKLSALEDRLKRYLDNSVIDGEELKSQKDVIQGLISDISHQTLTPISNLKIYTELLREEEGQNLEVVETVREQTERLDFLIQSLVKLSRMETGIIAVHPKQTNVSQLFEIICQEYKAHAEEKQISLHIHDTELEAKFDLKWTAEAVGNIVDNAVKYTGTKGQIIVTAEAYSFFVRIDISDNGTGIDEEEIPRIFGRFYRSLSVSDEPGVGIGLYLAREIIKQEKGYIKVSSQKGEGTVFSVFLPR